MPAPYAKTVLTGNGGGHGASGGSQAALPAGPSAATGGEAAQSAGPSPTGGPAAPKASPGAATRERPPVLLATLGAACISASAVLIKLANTGPATAAFYRCFFALPLLAVLAVLEQRRRGRRPWRARGGAVFAGLFLAIDLVLWNHAIADVGAGIATVLGNLQVLFVTAAAWALFHERPARRFLLALPVVLVGVVLVAGLVGTTQRGLHPLAGIEYGIGTSIAYACFLLILRQATSGASHVAGPLAEATLGCAVGALLLGLAFGGLSLTIPLPSLGWLLLLAMTSQTAGWLLITSSLPRLPAAISSLLLLLQPAASIVLAAVVLAERPSPVQLGGAVLVCGGVLIATKPTAARRTRPLAAAEQSNAVPTSPDTRSSHEWRPAP
jgi:drug/metabolite transporter (DMT)-like permease